MRGPLAPRPHRERSTDDRAHGRSGHTGNCGGGGGHDSLPRRSRGRGGGARAHRARDRGGRRAGGADAGATRERELRRAGEAGGGAGRARSTRRRRGARRPPPRAARGARRGVMDTEAIRRITSRLWGPVCAITAAHGGEAGGPVAVGVLSASILPEAPRVLIEIWRANRTHDLIAAGRAFAVHPLAKEQVALVRRLGFRSGHEGASKLEGLPWTAGVTGSPILTDRVGYL